MMRRKTIRMQYSKGGLLRFLGHLDLTRILTRAFARSAIPVLYSQGFSPHMKVSFGPPLPLGFSGKAEYLDALINDAETMNTTAEWQREIQDMMPEGLKIRDVRYLEENAVSLAKAIDRAEYEIALPEDSAPSNEKLARFLQNQKITVEKTSKGRTKLVDIRPAIESIAVLDTTEGFAEGVCYQLVMKIEQLVSASPVMVLEALLEKEWQTVPGIRVHRKQLYSSTGLM